MKLVSALALLCLPLSVAWAAGVSDLCDLAPPEARVLAGLRPQAFASEHGQKVFKLLQSFYPRLAAVNEAPPLLPAARVEEILVVSAGTANTSDVILLLRVSSAGFTAAEADKVPSRGTYPRPLSRTPVDGLSWLLMNSQTVAVGPAGLIDRWVTSRDAPAAQGNPLASTARILKQRFDFWAVSTARAADLAEGMPEGQLAGILKGDVMAAIIESSVGVKAENPVRIEAEALTRTAGEATDLVEIGKFLAGIAQVTLRRTSGGGKFFETLRLEAKGNRFLVSAVLSAQDLDDLLRLAEAAGLTRPRTGRTAR